MVPLPPFTKVEEIQKEKEVKRVNLNNNKDINGRIGGRREQGPEGREG